MPVLQNILGALNAPTNVTATAANAMAVLLPPWPGVPPGRLMQVVKVPAGTGSLPRIEGGEGILHVTKMVLTTPSNTQKIAIMRPRNWTYTTVAIAKGVTVIPNAALKDDPGLFSTNYKYNNGLAPAAPGDDTIATGDYVAYQLADGTWQVDIIASGTFGSTLTLTTGTPNTTNGYIPANSPFYFFGIITSADPAVSGNMAYAAAGYTWNPDFQATIVASATNDQTVLDNNGYGLMSAFNPGDPLMVYHPQTTAAGILNYVGGFYSRY
jgi:hypothetical protein